MSGLGIVSGGGGGLDGDSLPWANGIWPLVETPVAETGTPSTASFSNAYICDGWREVKANSSASYDLVFGAGTWTLEVIALVRAFHGTGTFTLDGEVIGTVDFKVGTGDGFRTLIEDIVIASSGKKRLTITLDAVGPADLQYLQFRRTA